MKKPRTDSVRFRIGQTVIIGDAISTIDAGELGVITHVQRNRHSRTLDSYVVTLPSGTQKTFWDIQLKRRDRAQVA